MKKCPKCHREYKHLVTTWEPPPWPLHFIDGTDCVRNQLAAMTAENTALKSSVASRDSLFLEVQQDCINERKRAEKAEAQARENLLLSPSEVCKRYHNQSCHRCDDFTCGDNQHPAKATNTAQASENARLREALEEMRHIIWQMGNYDHGPCERDEFMEKAKDVAEAALNSNLEDVRIQLEDEPENTDG